MNHAVVLLAPLLLLVGMTASAAAQEDEHPIEARIRKDCRLAGQVLASGHPHTRIEWAREIISTCPDEGLAYFSARWATAPADTALLEELENRNSGIRDARVYARLPETALDRSRPDAVRVAAMISLTRYVYRGIVMTLGDLRVPEEQPNRIRSRGGWTMHPNQMDGAQPLGSVFAEVKGILDGIAAYRSGAPREIGYAAAVLSHRLSHAPRARVR